MPRRSERDPLSRERILQAAMSLADREGIDAVSMRRVGAELGVEAMSLYRHIPNKEALIAGLHALMLTEVRHHDGPSGDWQERLRVVMRSLRGVYLTHPSIAQLSVHSQGTDVGFVHFEQDLATMAEAGFAPAEAGLALRSLLSYTTGFSMREIGLRASRRRMEDESPVAQRSLAQYPHLMASYSYLVGEKYDQAFEYGLERILAGIELERDSSLS
ncbi:MAG: TetR/AcrR family transcriptional regulator C-terminal domain-containing protein [Dehalococcoidia bacterium]